MKAIELTTREYITFRGLALSLIVAAIVAVAATGGFAQSSDYNNQGPKSWEMYRQEQTESQLEMQRRQLDLQRQQLDMQRQDMELRREQLNMQRRQLDMEIERQRAGSRRLESEGGGETPKE